MGWRRMRGLLIIKFHKHFPGSLSASSAAILAPFLASLPLSPTLMFSAAQSLVLSFLYRCIPLIKSIHPKPSIVGCLDNTFSANLLHTYLLGGAFPNIPQSSEVGTGSKTKV